MSLTRAHPYIPNSAPEVMQNLQKIADDYWAAHPKP